MEIDKFALSISEAARAVSLGRTTIFGEIRSKRLIAKKVGRRTVILRDDLEAWLKARQNSRGGNNG